MKSSRYVVAALLAQAPLLAQSETPDDCRRIDNDTQRLACYDGIFGPPATTAGIDIDQPAIDQPEATAAARPETIEPSAPPVATQPEPAVAAASQPVAEAVAESAAGPQPVLRDRRRRNVRRDRRPLSRRAVGRARGGPPRPGRDPPVNSAPGGARAPSVVSSQGGGSEVV